MNIGKKIKELRIKNEMTQEELASTLRVSMQAVSRWETAITYPDITLLPIIASLFHITTDELLGVDLFMQDEFINNCVNAATNAARVGDTEKRINILRDGLKQYPNNYILLEKLISALGGYYYADTSRKDVLKEIIKLSEKVLKECNDDTIRNRVSQELCYAYNENGENLKAIEIAKKMASIFQSSEVLMSDLLEGEESVIQAQRNIELALSLILIESQYKLIKNDYKYNIKVFERMNEIIFAIFETQEYGLFNHYLMTNYLGLAYNYAILNDLENTLSSLEKTICYASKYQKRVSKQKFNNVLFNKIYDDPQDIVKNTKITEHDIIINKLNNEVFNFIKEDPRYLDILDELKIIK